MAVLASQVTEVGIFESSVRVENVGGHVDLANDVGDDGRQTAFGLALARIVRVRPGKEG
jgi:hypothetical protein